MDLELGDDPYAGGPEYPEHDWDESIRRLEARIEKKNLEDNG